MSINISSFFKDPAINLNNITSTYELSQISLQENSINSNSYNNFSTTNYNLVNILSNSLQLSVDHILNTSTSLIYRFDKQLLLYFQSNIILNTYNITIKLDNYLNTSVDNIYINTHLFLKYLYLNTSPSYIFKYISSLSNSTLDLYYNNPNNYSLDQHIAPNINNNLIIYDIESNINYDNKIKLISIINAYKINNTESFNYDDKILNQINLTTGLYYNSLIFQQLFNIINNAIKNYITIYLLRSTTLDNNYSSGGFVLKNNIVDLFLSNITDYTKRINIMNTLLLLQKNFFFRGSCCISSSSTI